jgi:aspartyl-tRNA(Asn)/glutamyl-tRNA(Gln) amidotransferase subunit A
MTNDEGPLTIGDAAKRIRSSELTPSSLLEICLARIDRYEPKVKAWVYIDRERARREADQLTNELKNGLDRGPLHGIPIGVKDIIDVFDMPTGCGSKLWANSYARRDATCVERLRQAGALILGKTVTTAYAYLDPPVTRNPWNLERTPGGSSSGSAAAVACGMCLGALGTQTGGSIIRPAAFCGVCALKPTYGRVSVDGVLPLAPSLDHVGVMANCVRDLAVLFEVIAGPVHDCVGLVDSGPEGIELSQLCQYFDTADSDLLEEYRSCVGRLDVSRKDVLSLPPGFSQIPDAHLTTMAVGASAFHADRLRRTPGDYPQRIRDLIETGLSRSATQLTDAAELYVRLRRRFGNVLGKQTVLITPATTGYAPTPETTGNPAYNSPWSFLGLPTVSVPAGRSADGLPCAVQFVAANENEAHLLASAAWSERQFALPRHLPPVP